MAFAKLKKRAAMIKKDLGALYIAYGDPRTGKLPKAVLLLALGYALSPIDLIPDFIPVLGMLDDLLVVPGLIALSIRLLPPEVLRDARATAEKSPPALGKSRGAAAVIISLWVAAAALIAIAVFHSIST